MNWGVFLKYAMQALTMVPSVVLSIEKMGSDAKAGATKKQLAMQALGLASGVATQVLPEHQAAIDAATALTSNAIDNTVALYNAVHPDFQKTPAAAPAPALVDNNERDRKLDQWLDEALSQYSAAQAPAVPAPVVAAGNDPAPLVTEEQPNARLTSDEMQANLTGPGLHNVVPA